MNTLLMDLVVLGAGLVCLGVAGANAHKHPDSLNIGALLVLIVLVLLWAGVALGGPT